jgi:hypothetical protein
LSVAFYLFRELKLFYAIVVTMGELSLCLSKDKRLGTKNEASCEFTAFPRDVRLAYHRCLRYEFPFFLSTLSLM